MDADSFAEENRKVFEAMKENRRFVIGLAFVGLPVLTLIWAFVGGISVRIFRWVAGL